jgi:hypothetical protein
MTPASTPHGADEIAEPVNRQERRALKWGDEEAASHMRAMVLDTVELRGDRGFIDLQRFGQRRLEVANLRDVRQAITDRGEPRTLRERKQQLAVKMRARIAGDRHVRQIARVEAAVLQAVADGGSGNPAWCFNRLKRSSSIAHERPALVNSAALASPW